MNVIEAEYNINGSIVLIIDLALAYYTIFSTTLVPLLLRS